MAANLNFEPFIERDLDGIRAAIRQFRASHSSEELFLAVARFAVLAYAPSQHAKRALLAALWAHEVRDQVGGRWDELLTACAIYAAQSRLPWSEPPILDPPRIEEGQRRDTAELREAIAQGDRLRGERWLAARLDDPALASDLFTVAADELEDGGHDLVVATASWKLSAILGARGRFAALRVPIWEMTASPAPRFEASGDDGAGLLDAVIDRVVAEHGSPLAMQLVFVFDAAAEAAKIAGDDGIRSRAAAWIRAALREEPSPPESVNAARSRVTEPVYPLARDYASYLGAHAVAARWRAANPRAGEIIEAARRNLEEGPSFEEWAFA